MRAAVNAFDINKVGNAADEDFQFHLQIAPAMEQVFRRRLPLSWPHYGVGPPRDRSDLPLWNERRTPKFSRCDHTEDPALRLHLTDSRERLKRARGLSDERVGRIGTCEKRGLTS